MPTTFVNERRKCGCTVEGFGEHATRWNDYEYRCHECGEWTREIGDVSVQVGDDPDLQAWICPECIKGYVDCDAAGVPLAFVAG